MNLQERLKQLDIECGQELNKFLALSSLGTILNLIEESIDEMEDEEVIDKFNELLKLVLNKRKTLMEKECVKRSKKE